MSGKGAASALFLVVALAHLVRASLDQAPVVITPVTDVWIQRGLEIAAIILGLVCVFAGYRLFKLILFIAGFSIFYYLCYNILSAQVQWAEFWILLISAGSGLLGGALLLGLGLAAFRIAAFLFGFIAGTNLAYLVLSTTPLGNIVRNISPGANWEIWVIVGVILGTGLIVGTISAILTRVLLILGTSMVGAFIVGTAVDALAFQSMESKMLLSLITQGSLPSTMPVDWHTYTILGGTVALAVVGIVVQLRATAHQYNHHHHEEEKRPLLIQDYY